jgi:hypothetical protein
MIATLRRLIQNSRWSEMWRAYTRDIAAQQGQARDCGHAEGAFGPDSKRESMPGTASGNGATPGHCPGAAQ